LKLITELNESVEHLIETDKSGKPGTIPRHFIKGIFIQCDIKNRNGRIYPMQNVGKEIERHIKENVNTGRSFGELGHPIGPQINLDRVSHIMTELYRDGSNYHGKAMLCETPMGSVAKGILKSGGKLGVSTRGMGSVVPGKDGAMIVQKDFKLATPGDIVADPSAPKAFVEGIMEGVEFWYDSEKDEWIEERVNTLKNTIKKMSLREIEERKIALFENFISSLALS
jgi:hypothetical protein